ncbi:MAG TPA: XrtB/PEP-CTERM-associated transcriptional regulator EpsA [Burkholderiales bacterium]
MTSLTPGEIDHLFLTIESSLQMRRRYQFYIWAQSRLFILIPHDILVCAHYDHARKSMSYDTFSMFPIPRVAAEGEVEPLSGLVPKLLDAWTLTDGTPCAIDVDSTRADDYPHLVGQLRQAGISEVLMHGMMSTREENVAESFFVFLRVDCNLIPAQIKRDLSPMTVRHSFILEMLLPNLHATYLRTLSSQDRARERPSAVTAPGVVVVTEREREILGWVREGLSNQAIGVLLDISPLTVKNHVQKILRKLNATNRAQAVSKALSLRLIAQTENSH